MKHEFIIQIINQVVTIESKIKSSGLDLQRNFQRLKRTFSESGYDISIPLNEKYDDRRTDYECNIVGNGNEPIITEVIKPIIYFKSNNTNSLIQKGIVIAESK